MRGLEQIQRPRRLRASEGLRALVRETEVSAADFIYPLFIVPGKGIKREISSLPGNYHLSPDKAAELAREVHQAKIPGILLFGLPEYKDANGSGAWAPEGPVQQAVALIKAAVPELVVMTDVCLCAYTDHGHCGVVHESRIENDASVGLLAKVALSHAVAGADIVAPSDMMDGRVGAMRAGLDAAGFSHVGIMSYAAKYASAFYGPFRAAADSAPQFGDRRSYQMDPANAREAMREIGLDLKEGADIILVKPAMAYGDITRRVRTEFNVPVAAYNVSGEFAMVKAAAAKGWVDERRITMEILTGIKRAGADMIITYHALEAASWLKG